MQEGQDILKTTDSNPPVSGETISELAHRHLRDENHKTTDEELRNARIEFSTPPAQDDENLFEVDNTTVIPGLPGESEIEEDDHTPQKKGNAPNPYDLLGS